MTLLGKSIDSMCSVEDVISVVWTMTLLCCLHCGHFQDEEMYRFIKNFSETDADEVINAGGDEDEILHQYSAYVAEKKKLESMFRNTAAWKNLPTVYKKYRMRRVVDSRF